MQLLRRVSACLASIVLFGAAAALFLLLARKTQEDADAEIVGWSVMISLSLVVAGGYFAWIGLR
ncbi:MAG: hypothetical protein JO353_02210 [Phycisphaerae bacterium]|nr:hypothetical protein [Phycisphaerae bacterium]